MKNHDIAIIGVGAAGMMAAIIAGRQSPPGTRIVALDGAKKLGSKILVAGGGRCNVTHDVVHPRDYFGSSNKQIQRVLGTFSVNQTVEFFRDIGVNLKREETGKLFPTTDRAQTVLDALANAMNQSGVEIRADHRVLGIERADAGFQIITTQGTVHAKQVILATGGKSLPKTGSDGAGYGFAQALGHTVTPTTPALVPLVLKEGHWLTKLSGIAVDVTLTLAAASGKSLYKQSGPMLLTHFGLSGPAAMDMSRHWITAHEADPDVQLTANFTGHRDFAVVDALLQEATAAQPKVRVANLLRQWLPERLAEAIVETATEIDSQTSMGQLKREDRRALAHALIALPLPVVRDRGYLFAEVTAGGVPLHEIDLRTMRSRMCEGLYLCGEILNVDGRIGGYNFQWAWCTGRLAGQAAAQVR